MNKIRYFYWRFIASPEKYARHIGVKIGKNCLIATRLWSSEPYLITIGDNVQVARDVAFFTHGGGLVIRSIVPDYDSFGKITIEDNVYIGAHSLIMPGVTIGAGALVAAGSVVMKSVPAGVVVGGNPAKYICTVDEYIQRNLKYNLHTKELNAIEKREFLQSLAADKFIQK